MKKIMKMRWFATICMLFAMVALFAQSKEASLDSLYQRIQEDSWRIDVNRVSSATMPNTERFNPTGYVEMKGVMVKGELPFFGKAYQLNYDGKSGIVFNGQAEQMKVEKKAKQVEVQFEVKNGTENFKLYIQFYLNGKAYIRLSSTQREASSYDGTYQFLMPNNEEAN